MKTLLHILFGILICAQIIKTDAVCDLDTLKLELAQDLADNGMLDCMRVIDPPHSFIETENQKNLRLAAQWDTSCSFEAASNWKEILKQNLGIPTLVDSIGEPVEKDSDDQADMCEIVRAAIAKNVVGIEDLNMQKLPNEVIEKIDCAGVLSNDIVGTRICAASGGSFFSSDSWTIFLDSSAIRIGNVPNFTKKEEASREYKSNGNNSQIINDLLKFSPNVFVSKENELSEMIDKAKGLNEKKADEPLCDGSPRNVHPHIKRLGTLQFSKSSTPGKFSLLDGAQQMFTLDEDRIVFGYYMASFKLAQEGTIALKMNFEERDIAESRQILGPVASGTMTGAFASVYNAKSKEYTMEVIADVDQDGSFNYEEDLNFTYGAMTFPCGQVFKHLNSRKLEIFKSAKFIKLDNFELNFANDGPGSKIFLIFVNFSFKANIENPLHLRLIDLSQPKLEHLTLTTATISPTTDGSSHLLYVWGNIPENKPQKFSIAYKSDGNAFAIDEFTDSHYSQSISAFELPKTATFEVLKLHTPISLNTNGEWRSFGFRHKITVECKLMVMIVYNVNLKMDKKAISVRIRYGMKFDKKSTMTVRGNEWGHASGYVFKALKKGEYEIDLDFKSDSNGIYEPDYSNILSESTVMMEVVALEGK